MDLTRTEKLILRTAVELYGIPAAPPELNGEAKEGVRPQLGAMLVKRGVLDQGQLDEVLDRVFKRVQEEGDRLAPPQPIAVPRPAQNGNAELGELVKRLTALLDLLVGASGMQPRVMIRPAGQPASGTVVGDESLVLDPDSGWEHFDDGTLQAPGGGGFGTGGGTVTGVSEPAASSSSIQELMLATRSTLEQVKAQAGLGPPGSKPIGGMSFGDPFDPPLDDAGTMQTTSDQLAALDEAGTMQTTASQQAELEDESTVQSTSAQLAALEDAGTMQTTTSQLAELEEASTMQTNRASLEKAATMMSSREKIAPLEAMAPTTHQPSPVTPLEMAATEVGPSPISAGSAEELAATELGPSPMLDGGTLHLERAKPSRSDSKRPDTLQLERGPQRLAEEERPSTLQLERGASQGTKPTGNTLHVERGARIQNESTLQVERPPSDATLHIERASPSGEVKQGSA